MDKLKILNKLKEEKEEFLVRIDIDLQYLNRVLTTSKEDKMITKGIQELKSKQEVTEHQLKVIEENIKKESK